MPEVKGIRQKTLGNGSRRISLGFSIVCVENLAGGLKFKAVRIQYKFKTQYKLHVIFRNGLSNRELIERKQKIYFCTALSLVCISEISCNVLSAVS